MYWKTSDMPEMQGLSKEAQKELWREAYFPVLRSKQGILSFVPLALLAGLGSTFGAIGAAIGGGLGGLCFWMILEPAMRRKMAEIRATWVAPVPPPAMPPKNPTPPFS